MVLRFDDFEEPSILERAVKTSLIQAQTAVDNSSLMPQNRLPNSVMMDLEIGESQRVSKGKALVSPARKAVDFGLSPSGASPEGAEDGAPSGEGADGESNTRKGKVHTNRFSFLFGGSESLPTLPKLVDFENAETTTNSFNSWSSTDSGDDSDSSNSRNSSEGDGFVNGCRSVMISRISGVPLEDRTPKKARKKRIKDDAVGGELAIVASQCNSKLICRGENGRSAGLLTDVQVKPKKHATIANPDADSPRPVRKRTTALTRYDRATERDIVVGGLSL